MLICKLCISFLIVLMLYLAVYVPYFVQVLSAYGTEGIYAPACSMEHLSGWKLSVGGYLLLLSFKWFIGYTLNVLKTELEKADIQEVIDECNRQYQGQ